jgi:hypothetical protein
VARCEVVALALQIGNDPSLAADRLLASGDVAFNVNQGPLARLPVHEG